MDLWSAIGQERSKSKKPARHVRSHRFDTRVGWFAGMSRGDTR